MKISTKALLTALIFFNSTAVIAQSTFQKTYSSTNAFTSSLVPNKNGFIVTGSVNVTGQLDDIFIASTNKDGELKWSKTYGTELVENNIKTISTASGNSVTVSNSYNPVGNQYDGALIFKAGKNGDLLWSKKIHSSNLVNLSPAAAMEDAQGNYVILLNASKDQFASHFFELIKLNSSGNVIWQKLVKTLSLDYTEGGAIVETPAHDILISFTLNNAANSGRKMGIMRFNANGKPLSYKTFCTPTCSTFEQTSITSLYEYNNTIIATGYYYDYSGTSKTFAFPVSNYATTVKATLIPGNNFSLQHFVNNGTIPRNNAGTISSYFFSKDGSMYGSTFTPKISLKKFDNLGRLCSGSKPKFDSTKSDIVFSISDEAYSIGKDSVYMTDILLSVSSVNIQTNDCSNNFSVPATAIGSENYLNTAIAKNSIYPNPAQNILNVRTDKQSVINLVNTSGKILLTTKVNGTATINIAAFKPGIYYIKNITAGTTEKVVIIK